MVKTIEEGYELMSYIITHHAVERYIKRFAPEKKFVDAKYDIERFLRFSKPDAKSLLGDKTRIFEDIRFVIKDENVCVSILPAIVDSITKEELDYMQETHSSSVEEIKNQIAEIERTILAVKEEKLKLSHHLNELHNKNQDLKNRLKEIDIFYTFNKE